MRLFLTILMVLFGTGVATAQEDNSGGEQPAEASPEEPTRANAVIVVPNSDISSRKGPIDWLACW